MADTEIARLASRRRLLVYMAQDPASRVSRRAWGGGPSLAQRTPIAAKRSTLQVLPAIHRAFLLTVALAVMVGCGGTGTTSAPPSSPISSAVKADLVSTGKLRVGLNMGNPVLAKQNASGVVSGIAVDLAKKLARGLGVQYIPVEYPTVGAMINGLKANEWDVAFAAVDPTRAAQMDFTPAYMVVPNNYVVPVGSSIRSVADADMVGTRIAVAKGFASDLYLSRNLKQAHLVRADTPDSAFALLVTGQADAYATSRDEGLSRVTATTGYRVLDESYNDVMHAVALPKGKNAGLEYLARFLEQLRTNGWIRMELSANGLNGERVAPPA